MNQRSQTEPHPEPLAAFADGELDARQSIRVLEQMAEDHHSARRVLHERQLREAVSRVMGDPTVKMPAVLRQRIEKLAATHAAADAEPVTGSPVLASIGRWAPAAVAAVLFLSSAAALYFTAAGDPLVQGIIPASQVERFARRHVGCSRMIDALVEDPGLPRTIEELPAAVSQRFGATIPGLDLSSIGYEFENVGACTVPGAGAVHLIYRAAAGAGHDDSISLWIRPHQGRIDIEPGRVYTLAGASSAHPLMVWLDGGLVYWVTGDSLRGVEKVAHELRT